MTIAQITQILRASKPVGLPWDSPDALTAWRAVVSTFADYLEHTQPNFSRTQFLRDCDY